MPLDFSDDRITLSGICPIEEAEPLLDALRRLATPRVDVAGLDHAHTAVLQVLMACQARILGTPTDAVTAASLAGLPREEAAP